MRKGDSGLPLFPDAPSDSDEEDTVNFALWREEFEKSWAEQKADWAKALPAYLPDQLRQQVKHGVQSNDNPSREIEWEGSVVRTHPLLETYDEQDFNFLDPHLVYSLPTFINGEVNGNVGVVHATARGNRELARESASTDATRSLSVR